MEFTAFIESVLRESGVFIMKHFGDIRATDIKVKTDPSQLVTEVDIKSEKKIIAAIKTNYPDHSILAEESGFIDRKSEYVWIIDPIDGTSNFAHGLPWFGIMIALCRRSEPVASGIYLPATDEMFLAEKGNGAWYNGSLVVLDKELTARRSLVSYNLDYKDDTAHKSFVLALYGKIAGEVLNVRSTNSGSDYAYAAVGKLAATINLTNKIWDIAPVTLIAKEAGCIVTDLDGKEPLFIIDGEATQRNYAIIISHPKLHPTLLRFIRESRS